jgi:hypothetical protein
MENLEIQGKEYPILGYVDSSYGAVPLVNIPMVPDEIWNALEDDSEGKKWTSKPL